MDYILVGRRPWGLRLTKDERKLYVANGLSDDLSIIDTGPPAGPQVRPGRHGALCDPGRRIGRRWSSWSWRRRHASCSRRLKPLAARSRSPMSTGRTNPWYAVVNGRDGVFRPTRQSARPGAELAIKDAAATGRALGITFQLMPVTLRADEPVGPAIQALAQRGVASVLLDLPGADLREAAEVGARGPRAFRCPRPRRRPPRGDLLRTVVPRAAEPGRWHRCAGAVPRQAELETVTSSCTGRSRRTAHGPRRCRPPPGSSGGGSSTPAPSP